MVRYRINRSAVFIGFSLLPHIAFMKYKKITMSAEKKLLTLVKNEGYNEAYPAHKSLYTGFVGGKNRGSGGYISFVLWFLFRNSKFVTTYNRYT
jgi:hypothetical protein